MADRLGVRLLGPFRLDGVDLGSLRSRQSRTLLKRLALARGATVSVDALVEVVWPEARPSLPERDVHALVSRARAVVGPERLVRGDGGYALHADWWDLAELESLTREAVRRGDEGDHAGARTAAEAPLALVRGTLLEDEPDADWAAESRAAAATLVAGARRVAAAAALATGQVGSAAAHATEALRHDQFDEHALRTLMRAQASAGRPASALAEFARFRDFLAEELGVEPSAETRALHEQLLREEPAQPPVVTPSRRFVGRASQLAALDRELDRTTDSARVVLLTGEPGAGKTTLLDAWAGAVAGTGVVVLRGRAEEGELALQPILDALAGSLADVAHLDAGRTPGPVAPSLPGPGATADALNLRVFGRLDDTIGSLAGRGRLALLLDNGDDADPVSWSWLAHLGRRREPHVLVVVALRDRATVALPADLVLDVPPLALAEVTELVGPERAERLWERSGGNALLLTELARADGVTEDVPGSLRDAVSGRLRRAGAAAATLQTAAILGSGIDLDLIAAVASRPPLEVLGHLDTGVRQAFLTERDGTLAFRHELVRLAVAADAGGARRAWVHRRATEVLCERPDAQPLEVARHARECGDRPLAARCLADASDLALVRLDLPGAERLLDDALALDDRAPLRLRRSRIRMSRGDLDGADEDAEHAMATDDTGEALELRAWAARNRHDLDGAVRLGRAAAAAASDPAIRASSLIAVAFGHRGNGDLRQADAVLAEAQDAPAELGLPAWTGVLRVHQGRPTEALSSLEPVLGAEARRGTQGFWVEHTVQMTAHAYGLLGRTADALRIVDRLEREIERRGTSVRYAGVQHTYRSWLLRNLGDPGAEELALRGLEVAGSQEILAQCHLDVADSLLRTGDLAGAADRLAIAQTESGTRRFHNKWRFDQRRGLILARLGLAENEPSAALEAVEPMTAAAVDRGDARYAVLGRLVRAAAYARLGQTLDLDEVAADLAALEEVAALEGWWLAADVGDATGLPLATETASRLASLVAREAGPREAAFRDVAARRLG